jgi:alanine-alpha-ketoisovalerate/valine-pyruvate aminotransferase
MIPAALMAAGRWVLRVAATPAGLSMRVPELPASSISQRKNRPAARIPAALFEAPFARLDNGQLFALPVTCLRITCCRDEAEVREGLQIIARAVREAYAEDGS